MDWETISQVEWSQMLVLWKQSNNDKRDDRNRHEGLTRLSAILIENLSALCMFNDDVWHGDRLQSHKYW